MVVNSGTNANPNGLYAETCRVLIQQCNVALETPDVTYGRTAAHWATYYHRDDILAELIIAGKTQLQASSTVLALMHV